jgi:hypothetical protein
MQDSAYSPHRHKTLDEYWARALAEGLNMALTPLTLSLP